MLLRTTAPPTVFLAALAVFAACPAPGLDQRADASELAPCQLELHESWQVDWTLAHPNGFVSYQTFPSAVSGRNRIYLEHCPSGRVLRAEFRPDPAAPLGVYFLDRVQGSAPVTQSQLAREMEERGATTRIVTSNRESCACQTHFPQARGKKRPHVGN